MGEKRQKGKNKKRRKNWHRGNVEDKKWTKTMQIWKKHGAA